MAFIELPPRKFTADKDTKYIIKICFTKKNGRKSGIFIRIGSEVANKIGIKAGDRVSFSYDDENNRIWLIKKSEADKGYLLGGKPNANSFTIQVTWDFFIPNEVECNTRCVHNDIWGGGIRIFAELPASDLVEETEKVESENE